MLARYLENEREHLHAYIPPSAEQRSLDQLIKRRATVVTLKTSLRLTCKAKYGESRGLRESDFSAKQQTMWRLLQEGDELRVVADQTGAPTWARSIAAVTADMLAIAGTQSFREKMTATTGIYHLAAAGASSWHGTAVSVLRRMQQPGISTRTAECALLAVPTSAYPTHALQPLMSSLDTRKLRDVFQLSFPHWQEDLDRCMDYIIASRHDRPGPSPR
jgi:dTDP-4-dehydrorhamnose reductase